MHATKLHGRSPQTLPGDCRQRLWSHLTFSSQSARERLPVVAVRQALLELAMPHNPIPNQEVEIMTRRNARRFLALQLLFRVEGFCHRMLNDRHNEERLARGFGNSA